MRTICVVPVGSRCTSVRRNYKQACVCVYTFAFCSQRNAFNPFAYDLMRTLCQQNDEQTNDGRLAAEIQTLCRCGVWCSQSVLVLKSTEELCRRSGCLDCDSSDVVVDCRPARPTTRTETTIANHLGLCVSIDKRRRRNATAMSALAFATSCGCGCVHKYSNRMWGCANKHPMLSTRSGSSLRLQNHRTDHRLPVDVAVVMCCDVCIHTCMFYL